MKKFIYLLVIISLFFLFCSCKKTDKNNQIINEINSFSPKEIVDKYYQSMLISDYKTAKLCLSKEYLNYIEKLQDSDFVNISKLSNVKVSEEREIGLHGENYKEVQVVVKYYVEYRQVVTEINGNHMRFVYVGKKLKDSPWRIISIGAGP